MKTSSIVNAAVEAVRRLLACPSVSIQNPEGNEYFPPAEVPVVLRHLHTVLHPGSIDPDTVVVDLEHSSHHLDNTVPEKVVPHNTDPVLGPCDMKDHRRTDHDDVHSLDDNNDLRP